MTKHPVPPTTLLTSSLTLRAIESADARLIYDSYARDPDVARYMSFPLARELADTEQFVQRALAWWSGTGEYVYSIFIRGASELIGCCSTGPHDSSTYHWGLGYCFAKKYWGRGYAT